METERGLMDNIEVPQKRKLLFQRRNNYFLSRSHNIRTVFKTIFVLVFFLYLFSNIITSVVGVDRSAASFPIHDDCLRIANTFRSTTVFIICCIFISKKKKKTTGRDDAVLLSTALSLAAHEQLSL